MIAFVLGLLLLRRSPGGFTASWQLLGLVGGVLLLANLLAQFGLARVAANHAIVIMLSEIAVAALAAWLLAGEALAPREWIGGAIIVAASLFIASKESVGKPDRARLHPSGAGLQLACKRRQQALRLLRRF